MWLDEALTQLAAKPVCGYAPDAAPATEPTALAALALLAHDRKGSVGPAIEYLLRCQGTDGSVGVREGDATPGWPTGLAILAWGQADAAKHRTAIDRGIEWILSTRGKAIPVAEAMGHDTMLVAWPWAEGTHSWIEPTALHVLALKAAGQSLHERTREAIALLIDRQLPEGGCNYGNTTVLGQTLRPHVQPTGVALLALAGEKDLSGRIQKSVAWLSRSVNSQTTAVSLAWELLGLAAQGVQLADADTFLAAAHQRNNARERSPHKLALLALSAAAQQLPLMQTLKA